MCLGVISALHFLSCPVTAWKLGLAKQNLLNTSFISEAICAATGFGKNNPACYCHSLSWVRIKVGRNWRNFPDVKTDLWFCMFGSFLAGNCGITTLFLLCLHSSPCHSVPSISYVLLWDVPREMTTSYLFIKGAQ